MILKEFVKRNLPPGFLQYSGRPGGGVYLTFDDGPHPENTPKILEVLRRYRAPATFFVVGSCAESHPDLLRCVAAEGHAIGSHLFSHRSVRRMPPAEWMEEARRTDRILSEVTGTVPALLRPPYGEISPRFAWWALSRGKRIVLWSDDSRDSFIRGSADLLAHLESLPIRDGSIVLFHEDYSHTVEALPSILESLLRRGIRFSTLA
jgi:peptidoglycan/xylan/chitin deacetylase (PgdA/CDA1 family)